MSSKFCLVLGMLLGSVTRSWAQGEILQQNKADDLKPSISGQVRDATNGAPIVDAIVTARGPEERLTARTDAGGRYSFSRIPDGEYRISVFKEQYGKGASGESSPLRRVRLLRGQQLAGVDFSLEREAVVAGRVLDEARRPLVGVRISVLGYGYRHGRPMWWTQATARTNDLGEYRIAGLAPGKWYLVARLPMLNLQSPTTPRRTDEPVKGRPLVVFYPNADQPDGAEALYLTPGEERVVQDIIVPSVDTVCVSADLSVDASAAVHVSLIAQSPGWQTMVGYGQVKGAHTVAFCRVPRGAYYLQLTASGDGGATTGFAKTAVEVGRKDVNLGSLACDPPLTVPGKILVIEESQSDRLAKDRLFVGMEPFDRAAIYVGENAGAPVRENGDFVLPRLLNDLYWRVAVMGLPRGYYVKSAQMGGRDPRREPVFPGSGDLQITIASDGASIRGKAVGKKGTEVPDAVVVLAPSRLPLDGSPDLIATQLTDQAGEFEFSAVPPGQYQLLAFSSLTPGEGENPAFLRRFFTKETEIAIQARQSQAVTVRVIEP
ncbi:MAG: carboxypeptidase-like regulatory domain-containing protein [Acidobacteriota bacterium]